MLLTLWSRSVNRTACIRKRERDVFLPKGDLLKSVEQNQRRVCSLRKLKACSGYPLGHYATAWSLRRVRTGSRSSSMGTFEVLPRFTEFHHSQLSDERKSRSRRARNKGSAHVHTGDNSSVNKVHTRARARRPLTLNLSGFARHRCSFFPLYIYILVFFQKRKRSFIRWILQ